MTTPDPSADPSLGELALEDRAALRRVAGLSTELADVSEVEYRQLRLERVVLVGVWTEGSAADADNGDTVVALVEDSHATLKKYYREGRLIEPPGIAKPKAEYRRDMDAITGFLEDAVCFSREGWASNRELRTQYANWCSANGKVPATEPQLRKALAERGCVPHKHGGQRGWLGLMPLDAGQPSLFPPPIRDSGR